MNFSESLMKRVQFSKNDIKLGIKVPKSLTEDLAYETGVHIGDGHLGIWKRKDGWAYLNAFSGDYKEEMDFYRDVMCPMILRIYNKNVSVRKSTKNTVQVVFKSKAISTFKHNVLGLPSGNKKGRIAIPDVIMDSEFSKYCLQGIFDTDFSLTFRHGTYPKISGGLPIANDKLKSQIMKILEGLGIRAICSITSCTDPRYSPPKKYKEYRIDMNGRENLEKWMASVGFRSNKHMTKLQIWKKYGYCKQLSKISERKESLSGSAVEYRLGTDSSQRETT